MASPERTHSACEECDLLLAVPALEEGERAACPRCGNVLTERPREGFERALGFSLAGCVFFLLAMAFPFLTLANGGIENVMTLPEASIAIYREGSPILAAILFVCILALPAALMLSVIALVVPLISRRSPGWLPQTARLVFELNDWAMVEVFIIGVIVSLVKIAKLASVIMGLSFWAYIVFAICLTAAISGLDRLQVWNAIEDYRT